MKILVVLFGLLGACLASEEKRIVNGNKADLYAHPHQASLQRRSGTSWSHMCGATLIARNKLVTAAHCVDGQTAANLRIEVGAMNLYEAANAYKQTVTVSRFIMHPSYSASGLTGYPNDIAILYLTASVTLNENVQLAIPAPAGSSFANTRCVITGWGRTVGGGSVASHLKEAYLTKITNSACASYWGSFRINTNHICVFERSLASGSRPSACNGDSGGPMMCGSSYQYLAGVTSWGVSTCSGDYPSVYTRVSQYITWLNNN